MSIGGRAHRKSEERAELPPSLSFVAAPRSVALSFQLLLAMAAVVLVAVLVGLLFKDWAAYTAALTVAAHEHGEGSSALIAVGIAATVALSLIGLCVFAVLPVVCAFQIRKGRRWARRVLVVLAVVMVAMMFGGGLWVHLETGLMLAAVVFLFLPASRSFFRRRNEHPKL